MKTLIFTLLVVPLVIATWDDANWPDYTYMVTLFGCGGAIISLDGYNGKGVILTAAHCAHVTQIGVGCTRTDSDCGGDKIYQVEQRIRHPEYDANGQIDIGVLILDRAITYPGATAVELDTDTSITNNEELRLLGYGGISRGGVLRSDINELETAITNVDTPCHYHNYGKHICIIDDAPGSGGLPSAICGGDSGSPWLRNGKVTAVTHGVLDGGGCSAAMQQVGVFVPVFIEWIRSVLFDGVMAGLTFDQISTIPGDPNQESIGWVKVFGCTEQRTWVKNWVYAEGGNSDRMLQLAPYAITAKIVPQNRQPSDIIYKQYAVYAKQCSNPVVALNNGKEMSFKIDVNTLEFAGFADWQNDWYGEYNANRRLRNWCGDEVRPLKDLLYHGCGNVAEGLHVENTCLWEWDQIFHYGMDVYFGFDLNKASSCDGQGNGGRTTYQPRWTAGFTLGAPDNTYNGGAFDIGSGGFNQAFQSSQHKIIKRACSKCTNPDYKQIYYKRITNPSHFDAYEFMKRWRSNYNGVPNIINQDFALYSTLNDAIKDEKRWQYCNYDDIPGVGAFRDCGKVDGSVHCQWTSDVQNGGFNWQGCGYASFFSVYLGDGTILPAKQSLFNFDFGFQDAPATASMPIFMYIIVGLLVVNVICFGIYCCGGKKVKAYKVVSMETTDAESDIEN